MRKYCALFSCDEWKSRDSMRLLGVFTLPKLKTLIRKKIKSGDFEFGRDTKEIKEMFAHDLDIALTYGHIQELSINEEL